MSENTLDAAASDTPRTAHVRITPTNSVPTAARVTAGFERLHALATASDPSGWRERLGLERTPAPRLEWLLHSPDTSSDTGGENAAGSTYTDEDRSDAAVHYYLGAIAGPDAETLARFARELFPDEYAVEETSDPLDRSPGRPAEAVEFYGHPSEREDWLTQLTPTEAFLEASGAGKRLPLASIAETFADADRELVYQVLLQPLPDYTDDIDYFRRQCERGRMEPRDPDAPDAQGADRRHDRLLTQRHQNRLDELDAKDGRNLFTVNARVIALEDTDGATPVDATAADAVDTVERTGLEYTDTDNYDEDGDRQEDDDGDRADDDDGDSDESTTLVSPAADTDVLTPPSAPQPSPDSRPKNPSALPTDSLPSPDTRPRGTDTNDSQPSTDLTDSPTARGLDALTSALTACSRTGYQIAGEHVADDTADDIATALHDRYVHPPDYGGITTWLPGTRNRSRGIVADASEVGGFVLVTGDGLTTGGNRALGATPDERTAIQRPPDSALDTYRAAGLALGRPVDADGHPTDECVSVPPALQPLHAAWFGGTGAGKSTALTNAILENHGATDGLDLVIDPKGDGMPTEYLRAHYAEHGDLEDVYYFDCERALPAISFFDIRDELAAGIDRETAVEDRADHYLEILTQIMGRDRFENAVRSPDVIRYLVKAAFDPVHGSDAFTHRELHGMARRMHERGSAPGVTDPDLERMLSGVVANRPQTLDNIMQGVANRIEKIPADRRLARMFNHVPDDESDRRFDLERLLDEDAVVIIDTGGLRTRAQRVLALVVLSNLWTALRRRARRTAETRRLGRENTDRAGDRSGDDDTHAARDGTVQQHASTADADGGRDGRVDGLPLVNVYVEEAASIAVSELLGDLLAKARGFGCAITLAMQFPGQLRETDPAAYEELLNNVSTVITGKIPLEERFARRLATAEMDATEVGNRLRALRRGRWLARLPARFGEPEPRPFQLASLPLPPGHPERDEWDPETEAQFETAKLGVRARTDADAALTVEHASTPDDTSGEPADTPAGDTSAGEPRNAGTASTTGSSTDMAGETADSHASADRRTHVDSALPHTTRLPDPVVYDAARHELRCSDCGNRYAPTSTGMTRVLGCCGDRATIDAADVPICELGLTLDATERADTEWSDAQLLFLQAVHNAQQLRYEPPCYDIMTESMLRLAEYVGLDREAITPLVDAELLSHDTDHPHRLYSVTAAGRDVINESTRKGVDWGHNRGDLGESSEHVFLVQLGRALLEAEYRDDPDSPVQAVACYHDLGEDSASIERSGADGDESATDPARTEDGRSTPRLDAVGLDADGDIVVTLEAERINHDLRRAVPADYDKMAACHPDEAIWLVQSEEGAHRVLEALNDPLGLPETANGAAETEAEADSETAEGIADEDDDEAATRVEKSYAETTASSDFRLDAPGCTDIITMVRARKRVDDHD